MNDTIKVLRLLAVGAALTVMLLIAFFILNLNKARDFFLYQTLPRYDFSLLTDDADPIPVALTQTPAPTSASAPASASTNTPPVPPPPVLPVVGINAVSFQEDRTADVAATVETDIPILPEDAVSVAELDKLSDLSYMKSLFYSVESGTGMSEDDFNVDTFLSSDMGITVNTTEPKVLIFHTHMYEDYSDSDHEDINDGIFGVGDVLANVLASKYGIPVVHYGGRFDMVGGKVDSVGSYERMEPEILRVLEKYPTIEVLIDMHRDGLDDNVHLKSDINGQTTAPIMFVNGLTKVVRDGVLTPLTNLPNPYLKDNLAFSFQMQLAANKLYPGISRKIYLKPYRYSLNMAPKSLLIEVGAQTNTKQEARNAAEPIADILAHVLLGGS